MSTTARVTVASLSQQIVTEADAYVYMEDLRWADGPRCAHCEGCDVYLIVPTNGTSRKTAGGSLSQRRVWKCRPCKKQFSVLTGTIMHATKIPSRCRLRRCRCLARTYLVRLPPDTVPRRLRNRKRWRCSWQWGSVGLRLR